MTRKHLKNIEKYNEKIEEEAEKDLENEGGGFSPPQHESDDDEGNIEPVKNINIQPDGGDIFYATKIYNTLFELKRQYPNKYEFVRNTDRMKREWKRWSQEQFDNDYVYCYTKWFGKISKVNNELVSKFVF